MDDGFFWQAGQHPTQVSRAVSGTLGRTGCSSSLGTVHAAGKGRDIQCSRVPRADVPGVEVRSIYTSRLLHGVLFAHGSSLSLRCLCVLGDKVTQTIGVDDKRIRRDLQEMFGKLFDVCATFAGRSSEPASWLRRTTKESIVNGRSSPAPRSDSRLDEKTTDSTPPSTLPSDGTKVPWNNELASQVRVTSFVFDVFESNCVVKNDVQITHFIATTALPSLRKFLVDNDRVASACSNIVYHIVNPATKSKSKCVLVLSLSLSPS